MGVCSSLHVLCPEGKDKPWDPTYPDQLRKYTLALRDVPVVPVSHKGHLCYMILSGTSHPINLIPTPFLAWGRS